MKDNIIDTEFTLPVKDFLTGKGYSHIIALGIEPGELNDAQEPETTKENYWLEAIQPDDARLGYQEAEHIMYEMNDAEVGAMAAGKDEIQYMIKVPADEYNDYLKYR
jgi:hypothetical protein